MDEKIVGNVNPKLHALNEANKAFWDRRNAVEAKLLSDPETAHYVIDGLRAEEFRDARLRQVEAAVHDLHKELMKVHDGASNRGDQKDKRDFIDWVTKHNIEIERISDLWTFEAFGWGGYTKDTLKAWYKEAKPLRKLQPGRPKNRA